MAEPLTVLMSRQAADAFEARISTVLDGMPFRIVDLGASPDSAAGYAIDLAFLTRDVTADSGKAMLAPTLARFYEIVRASPQLAWLQTHSAGTDRPIYAELHGRNVLVTHSSGTTAVPVAQMAIAGVLALARRLPALMDAQRCKSWEPLHPPRAPRDLGEQTAVVIGAGPIGREIARLCVALGMHVLGVSRRPRDVDPPFEKVFPYGRVDAVLPQADFVILACPLTELTRGILNQASLRLLPVGAHVINVARGEVVVEQALIDALAEGRLGGAFLDVFEREPLDRESPLWGLPNVVISPHTAAHTAGHFEAVGRLFLENLGRWRRGEALLNVARFRE